MPETYNCAYCKETFEKGWSDEEAEEEFQSTFGSHDQRCVVCDDCYKKMGF